MYGDLSIIGLLLVVIFQRQIKLSTLRRIEAKMATQEEQLQDALSLLTTVASGVTEIISKLNALPTDNPAIQDEIDGIKGVAQGMADQINAVLNPETPPEG